MSVAVHDDLVHITNKPLIIACIMFAFVVPANATVIEYGSDGNPIVTERKTESAAVSRSSRPIKSEEAISLRELTRTVAVRFSGEPGVKKSGLDALTFIEVFEALIGAESAFNPKAVSPKGAQGLGQLMSDTASDLKVTDPFDPHQNLIGSATYLTRLLLQFGSLELALAAYNAGPERVKEYKGVPPFAETKAYIAKIKQSAGLPTEENQPVSAIPASAKAASEQIKKEQPLTGETSVWEF